MASGRHRRSALALLGRALRNDDAHLPRFMQYLERGRCYEEENVLERLEELTGGRGPDACIDAVGMEAHGHAATNASDRAKPALMLETDRPIALREAVEACRKGTVSVAGGYGGFIDRFPMPRAALYAAAARAHPAAARSIRAS